MPLASILRGAAVMLGPSVLLDAFIAGSTAMLFKRRVHPITVLGAAIPWLYVLLSRPRMQRWGATDEEVEMQLPGDEVNANSAFISSRAITIDAPIDAVWPWLAQIGQDRGGFYSFTWLENLGGAHIQNADRVHVEWQDRAVGDVVQMTPYNGPKVVLFEPEYAIAVEGGWTFALRALDSQRTRFILRSRSTGLRVVYSALLMDIPHFIMELGMLRGLKHRAERAFAANLGRIPTAAAGAA